MADPIARLDIDVDGLIAKVEGELTKRLAVVGEVIAGDARRSIRTAYPPASTPGQPPHTCRYQQGLLGSVYSEVVQGPDGPVAIVGTGMLHGLFLETGTSKMKPRPWLRPALRKNYGTIRKILTAPLPKT